MKLEIELDLNKIDYDSINKQIQEKIASIDLEEDYHISSTVNSTIKDEVSEIVSKYLRGRGWYGEITDKAKTDILDEIQYEIKSVVDKNVREVLDKIPSDELNELISDLTPKILMDLLVSRIGSLLTYSYETATETTAQICQDRVQSMLSNRI